MLTGPHALVQKYAEPHAICSQCSKDARFLVTRHDGSGRTTSCGPHLDRVMQMLGGVSPIQPGRRVRLRPWALHGTVREFRPGRDDQGRTVLRAAVLWHDRTETVEDVADLVPAFEP